MVNWTDALAVTSTQKGKLLKIMDNSRGEACRDGLMQSTQTLSWFLYQFI